MGKITKRQTKLHDQVMDLIHSDRSLSRDEIEFCFRNFNPLATHNVGKGAIFFTPVDLAWELAVMTQPKGAVIDLCAGIGVTSSISTCLLPWVSSTVLLPIRLTGTSRASCRRTG